MYCKSSNKVTHAISNLFKELVPNWYLLGCLQPAEPGKHPINFAILLARSPRNH
jgi:hypothetical protein